MSDSNFGLLPSSVCKLDKKLNESNVRLLSEVLDGDDNLSKEGETILNNAYYAIEQCDAITDLVESIVAEEDDMNFASCRNSDLIEELGQVEFVFSDISFFEYKSSFPGFLHTTGWI